VCRTGRLPSEAREATQEEVAEPAESRRIALDAELSTPPPRGGPEPSQGGVEERTEVPGNDQARALRPRPLAYHQLAVVHRRLEDRSARADLVRLAHARRPCAVESGLEGHQQPRTGKRSARTGGPGRSSSTSVRRWRSFSALRVRRVVPIAPRELAEAVVLAASAVSASSTMSQRGRRDRRTAEPIAIPHAIRPGSLCPLLAPAHTPVVRSLPCLASSRRGERGDAHCSRHCYSPFPFPGAATRWYLQAARVSLRFGVKPPNRFDLGAITGGRLSQDRPRVSRALIFVQGGARHGRSVFVQCPVLGRSPSLRPSAGGSSSCAPSNVSTSSQGAEWAAADLHQRSRGSRRRVSPRLLLVPLERLRE
jgi:hypothetical protein